MNARFEGKVAIVTGAGSGIGRAAAELLARQGCSVGVLDVRRDAADDVATAIEAAGGIAIALSADVADREQVSAALTRVTDEFGALHVLYNNAGVSSTGSVTVGTDSDWDRVMEVNAKGTFVTSAVAVPHIVSSGGGSIVNQASVAALVGVPDFAAYCAAKGAVLSLTRSMAIDLASVNIRVNVICPGTIFTPLIEPLLRARGDGDLDVGLARTVTRYPIGRLGTPQEIAQVAAFLASDDASFITGAVIAADGGMTTQ
jgi:NAD(P)-dependent dehydrogenase (short-subunit alcohol dehydrogenase family)